MLPPNEDLIVISQSRGSGPAIPSAAFEMTGLFETGSPIERRVVVGVKGGASTGIAEPQGSRPWKTGINANASFAELGSAVFNGKNDNAMATKLMQLEARTNDRLDTLSKQIEGLTHVVIASLTTAGVSTAPAAAEDLVTKFNNIVDYEMTIEVDQLELALASIADADAATRAAAGRILSYADPIGSLEVLRAAISREANSVTKAVLQGALRSAQL